MRMFFGHFFCLSLFLISSGVEAKTVQEEFFYGQCIHLGHKDNKNYASGPDIEMKLSQLGVNATKDDLSWDIEKASSLQTMPVSMNKIAYSLTNINARPLLILKGNSNTIPEGQPATAETRKAFATYANKAALVLKERNPIFEVWNEWNMGAWNNKKGPGTPAAYVELVKETYPEIKKVLPNGLVLAGAVGDDLDWKWTTQAIQLGLMDYADGLSVHTYNHCMKPKDRTGTEMIDRLVLLQKKLVEMKPEKEIPIYLTEYGWPSKDVACGGVSEDDAARNIAQLLLLAPTYPWLKGVWHYELLDEDKHPAESHPDNRERHFGHYRADGSLKPSGCVAKTIWDFIKDSTAAVRSNPSSKVQMVSYAQGKQRHLALWSKGSSPTGVKIFIPKEARTVPLCGYASAKLGEWTVVGPMPMLLEVAEETLPHIQFD